MDNAGERDNYKHHLVNGFAVKLAEGVSDGSLTSVNHEFTKLPGLKRGVQVHVVHSTAHFTNFVCWQLVDDEPAADHTVNS